MELKIVKNLETEKFDRFVQEHDSGSFLQSPSWGNWMTTNKKTPHNFAVVDGDENILLAAQVFETPIPKLRGTYLYIPYGPLIANSAGVGITKFFFEEIKKNFPKSLFTRVEPKEDIQINGKITKHIQPGKTLILDLTQSESELLSQMHHKTRYNIKVAGKHEVEIKISSSKEALGLIDQTSRRQGYKNHPLSYYQELVKFFTDNTNTLKIQVYAAEYKNKILASAIMVDYGATRTYLFGGTSEEDRNVMAPYLMHWQAIKDAKNAGLKHYDFWGIETASGQTPGFVRFKLGWGGKQVQYPTPIDLVQKPLWYNGYKLLRSLNRKLS